MIVASAALLAYTAFRAAHLSFTHDESLSYTIAAGDPTWRGLANHHPLNTLLMQAALATVGDSEWALRLPNLLAHALYLACGLDLARRVRRGAHAALAFALLQLDPFLLDFFGLARGYGLASALGLAALVLLHRAWTASSPAQASAWAAAALTTAALASYANFAWLFLQVSLLVACALLLGRDRARRGWRGALPADLLLVATQAALLADVARRLLSLRSSGELYDGGRDGFVADTARSLVETWCYGAPWTGVLATPALIVALATLALLALRLGVRDVRKRSLSFATLLFIALLLAGALPCILHELVGGLYPRDRSALYLVPLVAVAIVFALAELAPAIETPRSRIASPLALLVTAAVALHFLATANSTHTLLWRYDASTRAAILELGGLPRAPGTEVRLGATWLFEPALNYYRRTRRLDWLLPVTREPVRARDFDALLVYSPWTPPELPGYSVVRCFPTSGACLLASDRFPRGRESP